MLRNTIFNEKLFPHLGLWTHKFTKKRFSMLSLAAIMIIGTFAFATNLFFPTAKATYVEGAITQNTIWTLVDSPFVVSNNVTVYSSATLTIERGVEVRFGGDFSLIVEGRLIANGTQDRMITFSSNEYPPGPGHWGSIEFSGAQQSLLAYCVIEYAGTGITTESGNVAIRNCVVSNNYQYGISIANSNAQIQANEIANNSLSGVYVTGNNEVTIQNNTIQSNADGILLNGTVSGININQNLLLSNTQSGIHLNLDGYSSLTILYNTLSANDKGFYISGNASTQIANNSVSFNNVGFLYAAGQDHQAHWNDIYGNVMGMDAYNSTSTSVEVVNATYNYWGNESGPYHKLLNPAGTGNTVGGDGVNIDFIFFLTAPIGYINQRPVARLLADKVHISPGQQVTFFATNSTDDRRVDQYFFDFGDGPNSGWTTLSVSVHTYASVGTYAATVKVMDDFGVVSNNLASLQIVCEVLPPLTASLTSGSLSVSSGGQVPVTIQVTNTTSFMDNANVNLFSILGGSFLTSSGLTNSSGYFTTTFSAPNVAEITYIRIVASASKTGFVDGSDYEYLLIQPPLSVDVATSPSSILSEATANVSVIVAYSGAPVSGANVTVSSNSTGSFYQTIGVTDANGTCTFVFTAPQTATQLKVKILATATKSRYLEGQSQTQLTVEPKVLLVQVSITPTSVKSEMPSNVTVRVSYGSNPISGATVVLSSNSTGSFDPANGTTDTSGGCKFTFTSPQVTTNSSVTITATAIKTGYADGVNQTTLAVTLGTLVVQLVAHPANVRSKAASTITVQVKYNAKPVANAGVSVIVLSGGGALSAATGTTDANGNCTFVFTAPETTVQSTVFIAANATKSGYISSRQDEIGITIEPAGASGLPLWLILGIIAVAIVAVVLILIKLKILVIGSKGE